jgi:probable HAF family extracellular repeat protein
MIHLPSSPNVRPAGFRLLAALPTLVLALLPTQVKAQQAYKFAPFNNPFGRSPGVMLGINNKPQVVGTYTEIGTGVQKGFLKTGNVFTSIAPRAGVNGTQANGINDQGQVVGVFFDLFFVAHGFMYQNGVITTIDDPKSARDTQANGINNQGQIVGSFSDGNGIDHGFLLSKGVFTTFTHPQGAFGTRIRSINNNGDMVGEYTDSHSSSHGFMLSKGVFTTIDFPNAGFTQLMGINDHGDITGNAFGDIVEGGFVLSKGVFTVLQDDEPVAGGINNAGQVVGSTSGVEFIATPVTRGDDHPDRGDK